MGRRKLKERKNNRKSEDAKQANASMAQTPLQMLHGIVIVVEFDESLSNEKVPFDQLRIHF